MRDYLRLHFVILLWGITAVLGNLIELSATQLVLYRSVMAALLLAGLLGRDARVDTQLGIRLLANGMILGCHWILFFLAVKIANVSVCMIGMATVSFWTALLEPLIVRKTRFQASNVCLGLIVVFAVYLIFRGETQFHLGVTMAVVAAVMATLFSIFNGYFSGKASEKVIVMYEMAGAGFFCLIALVVAPWFRIDLASDRWTLSAIECLWFAIFVGLCTVYAYLLYVELLKRLSVFTINFANNLEPVYGIVLGAVFFGDHQRFGSDFYVGTTLILVSVLLQTWLVSRRKVLG